MKRMSYSYAVFQVVNITFLSCLSLLCVLPIVHILAVSLSGIGPSQANQVGLWPVDFNLDVYRWVLAETSFPPAFWISVQRVVLGVSINLALTLLLAYPLSKETKMFRSRSVYVWIIVFSMLFNGGLIPNYILIRELDLFNSIWGLILSDFGGTGALSVFLVVFAAQFFRQLPKEIEESATIDGATEYRKLWNIFIPLSMPALATIMMFSVVGHWNSWFDGLIYMTDNRLYPLQTFIKIEINRAQSVTETIDDIQLVRTASQRSITSAMICVAIVPIALLYPFLQKYFKDGIVLGSVKG